MGPAQFHGAYNVPTTASGAPPTIAIVDAYDSPTIESDLAVYNATYGLPACTTANGCFRKVNQTGGTTYPTVNPGWVLEIALDVETAHAMCQNCKILLVEATSNANGNLYGAVNEAVKLGATAISNSWSTSEYAAETLDDNAYFNHPGVVITGSTGDNGYGVQYPAASRYVVAVGGTSLTLGSGDSYGSESAWSGSGSGCSAYEAKPAWQTDAGCARRSVADVSADADPNTGAAIYDSTSYFGQSGWFKVGGTSLSSPLIAAVYALAGNTGSGSAPYANAGLLHDVTSGSNGTCSPPYLCTGSAGFDGPTGLGTPNGLGAFLAGASTPDFSLGASPATQTVSAGAGASYSVTVSPSGGFSGSVALGASSLPSGATASFSPATTTSTSTLTVSTTAAVSPGSYPFTITGTNGALTHTASATLVVQGVSTPDFSLGVSPASQTVSAGAGASYSVTVSPSGGFSGSVALSATGLPSGATAGFSPSSTTSTSTLTVGTTASVSPGSYPFTITGTNGALTHTASATLVVQGAASTGDFSLSASPASQKMPSGLKSVSFTITVTRGSGFTAAVTLSTSTLPPSFRVVFAPNPTTLSARLTVTGPGGGSTPTQLTVTGTGGGQSHTTTVTVIH